MEWAGRMAGRPAVPLAAAFVFGVFSVEGATWAAPGAVVSVVAALAAARTKRPGVLLGLCLALACAGGWRAAQCVPPCPTLRAGQTVEIEGRSVEVQHSDFGVRMRVAATRVDGVAANGLFEVHSVDAGAALTTGQIVRTTALVKVPEVALNPGEWNVEDRDRLSGLCARVTATFVPQIIAPAPAWNRWLEVVYDRVSIAAWTSAPSVDAARLYLSLALGHREQLTAEMEERFARSGLVHLLSISGLHVAAFSIVLFWCVRKVATAYAQRWAPWIDPRVIAAPVAALGVWAYVGLTGAQSPAVRSAIMLSLAYGSLLVSRRTDLPSALALTVVAVSVASPSALYDVSFVMSALSVAALVWVAPPFQRWIESRPPLSLFSSGRLASLARDPWLATARKVMAQTFASGVAVVAALVPVLTGIFHRVSLLGIISNMLCWPLSSAVSVVCALSGVWHALSPVTALPIHFLAVWTCQLMVWTNDFWSSTTMGTLSLPSFGLLGSAAWYGGMCAAVLARGHWRWLGALTPLSALAVVASAATHRFAPLEVTFLGVGHGDAIVAFSRGETAIIDGGGNVKGYDIAKRRVIPFLRERGVRGISIAALSHPHPDHAIGLADTVREFPTRQLLMVREHAQTPLGVQLRQSAPQAELRLVDAAQDPIAFGDSELTIRSPAADGTRLRGVNDQSLVLTLTHGNVQFLLTGDIEEAAEAQLLRYWLPTSPVTVVKVPHHGSRTSSSDDFVAASRPRYAVFCVGVANRYGLPRDDIVAKYAAAGARCYRTDVDGAVTFRSDGRDVAVTTQASAKQQFNNTGLWPTWRHRTEQ